MKVYRLCNFVLWTCCLLFTTCSTPEQDTTSFTAAAAPAADAIANVRTPIKGAWELMWGQYGNEIRDPGRPYQFKQFTENHWSLIFENGGKWKIAAAGVYDLNGGTYRETIKYAIDGFEDFVGRSLEWKYEVNGDTFMMTGPTKREGRDGAVWEGPLNDTREIRVRAKAE